MIVLEPVGVENHTEARGLSPAADQMHLIASVTESLADAYVWKDAQTRVARNQDGVLIGFVMIFPFELDEEPVLNIVRLLVDQDHQGAGAGRELLDATLRWIASLEPRPVRVRVSTFPENHRALRLYRTAGFEEDDLENGEIVLWRDLEPGTTPP
jgi:RimJ/RimL family protein N-acetyltransferase